MNSVGIDISKGTSTVTIMRPFGEVVVAPFDLQHTNSALRELVKLLKELPGETRIVMESTGSYHTTIAWMLHHSGLYVSVLNPKLVVDYGKKSLRCAKTDKKDATKLANYGLDNWSTLPRYNPKETTRLMLKTCYRQYEHYTKVQTLLKNSLISLLDASFPGINKLFKSKPRADGSEKWVDFVSLFWHCECVSALSEKDFVSQYKSFCKQHGYIFLEAKALTLYSFACECISSMPRSETAKLLMDHAITQLRTASTAVASLKQEMQALASSLPEYPAVMSMYGVGQSLGPQLIAEIGDVCRFHSKKALVAYAGLDSPPYQSGQVNVQHRSISKRGSPSLRRILYLVMTIYMQGAPLDEPIYQFIDKKRSEGKPFKVYMVAASNKFLRRYYAIVTAYLDSLENAE